MIYCSICGIDRPKHLIHILAAQFGKTCTSCDNCKRDVNELVKMGNIESEAVVLIKLQIKLKQMEDI